jgi:hypothetical protein
MTNMQSLQIRNADALCNTLRPLLNDDIEYLKLHPNPKFQWGNVSNSMSAKFNQFDELLTLPVFDKLAEHGFQIDKVFLYYIKPMTTKILLNADISTKTLTKASILIPIDYTPTSRFVWYNPDYVTEQHTMGDIPMLFKEHGPKVIQGSQVFELGTPLLIEHNNKWAGIANKDNPNQFVFLELTLKGNPEYEQLKTIF